MSPGTKIREILYYGRMPFVWLSFALIVVDETNKWMKFGQMTVMKGRNRVAREREKYQKRGRVETD